MQYVVVGMFARYGDAEAAVGDLELAGIVGEQVEVISDIDEDSRTADTPGEPSTRPRESHSGRIARLLALAVLSKSPTCVIFPASSRITLVNRNTTQIMSNKAGR